MKTIYNLAYGVVTGLLAIMLIVTLLASIHAGDNLFAYKRFWEIFAVTGGISLYLNSKREVA